MSLSNGTNQQHRFGSTSSLLRYPVKGHEASLTVRRLLLEEDCEGADGRRVILQADSENFTLERKGFDILSPQPRHILQCTPFNGLVCLSKVIG